MKVIICGAGQIGAGIAKYLSQEQTDVVVIDNNPENINKISDSLDLQAILGNPTHPPVLEHAGIREAQLIIAVTPSDETNILTCQIAHSLFDVPLKIAYLKNQVFFDPTWASLFSLQNIPIDVLISPEREIAHTISRTIQISGAFDLIPLGEDQIRVVGVRASELSSLIHVPLRQLNSLFPDLYLNILIIVRGEKLILGGPDEEILPGDDVYFISPTEQVLRIMEAFGYEKRSSRNILILGAGSIGISLARELEQTVSDIHIKLIEVHRDRAIEAAQSLEKAVVLCGDALDIEILNEANIAHTESIVAVTNDNEVNILASLLGKRNGAGQAITLINNASYTPLVTPLGIDAVISPGDITISSILHHVRRGRIRSVYTLREGLGELMEAEVYESSPSVNCTVRSLNNPNKYVIGAVLRDGQVVMAHDTLVLRTGDLVILFAKSDALREAESLFARNTDYF